MEPFDSVTRRRVKGDSGRKSCAWPVAALACLTLLGACAQQAAPVTSRPQNRVMSYDAPGPAGDPWGPYIREASQRFDVPERWIREVMRQESGGRATATSHAGAMGLMQVMPGTYAELRRRYDLGDDPYHPYDSIMAGTAYIREMYNLYGSPAFLAAYNAGPRRLEDYLWASRGLPNETRNYIARIGPRIEGTHPTRRAPPEVYAAAEIPTNIPPGPRRMDGATMLALREQREQRRDTAPDIQVARLPAGPVIRMDTVDTRRQENYQVASLAPLPPPGAVIRMDPIPDGSTYDATPPAPLAALPAPGPRFAAPEAPLPLPPPAPSLAAPAPRGGRGSALAATALPEPTPRGGRGQAIAVLAPLPVPPPAPPGRSLGLIGAAQAAPLARPTTGRQNWGVQVGAYSSESVARVAVNQVLNQAATLGSRGQVDAATQGRDRIYRARVTGLSRAAAEQTCAQMRNCVVLAP